MRNYVQEGDTLTLTAPYAVAAGAGLLVGALFAVAVGAAANGATVEAMTEGVFDLPVLSTDALAVGDKVYWDDTNKRVTKTATSNTLIGCAVAAKAAGVSTARVRLNGTV